MRTWMRTATTAVMCALLWTTAAAAASGAPEKLPDDVKWMMHLDAQAFRETKLGKAALALLDEYGGREKLDAVEALFNIDLREDVSAVTLAGVDQKRANGLLYVRGRFDVEALTAIVKAIDGYARRDIDGRTIHEWPDEKHPGRRISACFAKPDLLVTGTDAQRVARGASAANGGGTAPGALFALPEKAAQGVFYLAAARGVQGIEGIAEKHPILKKVNGVFLDAGESGDDLVAHFDVDAVDADAAAQMRQTLQGLVALALLNQEKQPELARLARSVTLEGDAGEARVRVVVRWPVEDALARLRERVREHHGAPDTKDRPDAPAVEATPGTDGA